MEKLVERLDEIEYEFNTMEWKKTNSRKNVSHEPCYSMSFGLLFRPFHGLREAKANVEYPKVYSLLLDLAQILKFPCTTFTINKNLACLKHIDKNNEGESVILSLGRFQGGRLGLEIHGEDKFFDIYRRPFMFNGSELVHFTEEFEGLRYSIILYNLKYKKSLMRF